MPLDTPLASLLALLTPMQEYDLKTLLHINPALDVLQISASRIIEINQLVRQFNHRLIRDEEPSLGDYVIGDNTEAGRASFAAYQVAAGHVDRRQAWTINTPADGPPAGKWLVQLNKSPLPAEADEYSQALQAFVFLTRPEPVQLKATELERVGYVRRLIAIDNFPDSDGTICFYVPVKAWRHFPEPVTTSPTLSNDF